jgi:hypothetical protein
MLNLRDIIERKGRLLAKSPQTRKTLLRFFEDPDSIDENLVYSQFKMVHMKGSSRSANMLIF